MQPIKELLQYAVEKKASDLHLSSGEKPIIRIDGDLNRLEESELIREEELIDMLREVSPSSVLENIEKEIDVDYGLAIPDIGRFRVNFFRQERGVSVVFRVIPFQVPALDDLHSPSIFKKLCALPHGLILVTGPTGSGKSTTLAAMVDHVNQHSDKHIITIEDPIEYFHSSKRCLVQQREVHRHTKGFQVALRAALREDPDYILVGEMRDAETIRLALTAAETGHLVFATLHTNNAPATVNRIIDVFPLSEKEMVRTMLAESLQAVISQRLIKRIGGGRIAAYEIMVCTTAIRNMIRENKGAQIYSMIQTGKQIGMQTMEQYLEDLVSRRLIQVSTDEMREDERSGDQDDASKV